MILYSFLGAGKLFDTVYEWDGMLIQTEFSCVACAKILNPDKIVIFETAGGNERRSHLEPQLADHPYEFVMIEDGKNKTELWQIFSRIVDSIPENAEIAFDVTNGFRFYPLLGLLAASFTETVKGTQLKYMFYGNYEANPDTSPKPMIDLTPMLDLLKWTTFADRFIQTGDSTDLAGMVDKFRDSYPPDSTKWKNLKYLSGALRRISIAFLMLRPEDIRKTAVILQKDIDLVEEDIQNIPEEQPLGMLMESIKKQYLQFSDDVSTDDVYKKLRYQRDLIFRYQNLGQYMQAISLAKEWIQTWTMVWIGLPAETIFSAAYRKRFNNSIGNFSFPEFKNPVTEFTEAEIEVFIEPDDLRDIYRKLSKYRNDLDHAGQYGKASPAGSLIVNINEVLEKFKTLPIPDDEE